MDTEFGIQSGSSNPYGDLTELIDQISRNTGLGSLSDAYGNMLRGINHRGLGNPINKNLDNSGIVFFTRPDLNLSYDNLAASRTLMNLAIGDGVEATIQRAIRTILDPRGAFERGITSPLVEHKLPFISLLSNNLLSLNGWPDRAPEVYTSNAGIQKEQIAALDGTYQHRGELTLSANFRNTAGSPILAMISAWLETAINCHDELMVPYTDNKIHRRLDYTTRVYHFTLDPSRRFIQQWVACGGGFPSTDPIGQMFNFQGGETMMQSSDQIPIQFSCTGADYNDPITLEEFNDLVAMFNPDCTVRKYNNDGTVELAGPYYRVDPHLLRTANYYGTPIIHLATNELMWFMNEDELNEIGLL